MPIEYAAPALIAIAVIVWLSIRQSIWTALNPARAWRTPLILIGVGLVMSVAGGPAALLEPRRLGALLVELVLGAAVGLIIGRMARLRPVAAGTLAAHRTGRRARRTPPKFEVRNGVWGLLIWLALIAVRIGIALVLASMGVTGLLEPGPLLVLLGINRLARTAVVLSRAATMLRQQEPARV